MICIFKCPGCNGNMTFDIEKQMLVCRSCGTEINAEDYDEKQIAFEGAQEYGEDTVSYRCPTCSAEVEVSSSQATCTCSYCGIEMAVFSAEKGRMAPEKIIPFEIDQTAAEVAFSKWWLDYDTMPNFNRKNMKFTIQPMYLPVWLVNANTKTDMSAIVRREENIGGTYSYNGMHGSMRGTLHDKMTFSDAEKRTRDYLIRKSLYSKFFKVPSNASYHFSSTRFFGIEPYNYTKLEDFTPGYISGFPAEHYSIEAGDVIPGALKRIKGFGVEQCKTYILGSSLGESEIVEETGCIQSIELKQITYAMVPVWICSYMFMGRRHMVYVNGQTGKADGQVVTSGERLRSYAVALFLSTFLEFFSFLLLGLALFDNKRGTYDLRLFLAFAVIFAASLSGNLPRKVQRERNGRKETVEMYSDIDYIKKDYVKPKNVVIRRLLIGIILLPIAMGCSSYRIPASSGSSQLLALGFITLVLSAVWTVLFMSIHVRKEAEQKPAEYNDYLNMSVTDILESSEQVY